MSIGVYGITHLQIPLDKVNYHKLSWFNVFNATINPEDQIIVLTHSTRIGRTSIHSTPDSLYTNLLNDAWKRRGNPNVVIIIYHVEEDKRKYYLRLREKDVGLKEVPSSHFMICGCELSSDQVEFLQQLQSNYQPPKVEESSCWVS